MQLNISLDSENYKTFKNMLRVNYIKKQNRTLFIFSHAVVLNNTSLVRYRITFFHKNIKTFITKKFRIR